MTPKTTWIDTESDSRLYLGAVENPIAIIRRQENRWVWSTGLPGAKVPSQPAQVGRDALKIAIETVVAHWFELAGEARTE
jgi:hypothetical protein